MNPVWNEIVRPSAIPIADKDIRALESDFGFALPTEYRDFLSNINGGRIIPEHKLFVDDNEFYLAVAFLDPISQSPPGIGLRQSRRIQCEQMLCLRQAIQIGSDLGTGFYFLILDGSERGSVYFSFKDDMPMLSPEQWNQEDVRIPESMIRVASSFDELGDLIMENATAG